MCLSLNGLQNILERLVWSPEARCQEVSKRFESYHRDGTLNFLTTGRMNRQSVVCVAQSQGGPCSGLLFTLKPGSNPGQTLQKLLDVRHRATGPLNESASARLYRHGKVLKQCAC